MFKRKFQPKFDFSVYNVKYGEGDSCPIDQSPVKSFNIDPDTGRPVSDITRLLRAQSQYEKDKIYNDLVNHEDTSGVPFDDAKGLSDAIKYQVPRLAQLPSELADFTESLYQRHFDELEEKKKKEREQIDDVMSDIVYSEAKEEIKSRITKKTA